MRRGPIIDEAVRRVQEDGVTGQISVNWSDPSVRKMTTRVTIWGTAGRISAILRILMKEPALPPTSPAATT